MHSLSCEYVHVYLHLSINITTRVHNYVCICIDTSSVSESIYCLIRHWLEVSGSAPPPAGGGGGGHVGVGLWGVFHRAESGSTSTTGSAQCTMGTIQGHTSAGFTAPCWLVVSWCGSALYFPFYKKVVSHGPWELFHEANNNRCNVICIALL